MSLRRTNTNKPTTTSVSGVPRSTPIASRLAQVLATGHARQVSPVDTKSAQAVEPTSMMGGGGYTFVSRMNVKIMGSKTVRKEGEAGGWDVAYAAKVPMFADYYGKLATSYPGVQFDFFTDGDPPDKEDDWKMFAAYCAAQPGNTLTIVRKDNAKNDAQKRIDAWRAKGAIDVRMQLSDGNPPKTYTVAVCSVVLVLNILPEAVVYDVSNPGDLGPMLDFENFTEFQITNGEWTVPNKNSARPILQPLGLPNTLLFDRDGMRQYLESLGVTKVVVKSQGQLELEGDFVGWGSIVVNPTFKILLKPMAPGAAVIVQ